MEALLARAAFSLGKRDWPAATADLDVVDRTIDPAAMERLQLASLMAEAGNPKKAIDILDQWIKVHPEDVRRAGALNNRCWSHALAGLDLDAGLRDCDAALRGQPGAAGILDSRGLIQLRRGDLTKAMGDYSAALAKNPRLPWSLYGRGIAKIRSNDKEGGQADILAAQKVRPDIAEEAQRFGIVP
jgi:tetratricopeptide (TPR) repeat protein